MNTSNGQNKSNVCPHCGTHLKLWQIKCKLCKNYVWRLPHILLIVFLALAFIPNSYILFDYFYDGSISSVEKETSDSIVSEDDEGDNQPMPRRRNAVDQNRKMNELRQKLGEKKFNERKRRAERNR